MVVGTVAESIEELLALDLDELSDAQVHALVIELEHDNACLAAARAHAIAEWDVRKIWADDRSKAASARLARDCRLRTKTAKAEVRRARALRTMPATDKAFAVGALSIDHVDALIRTNQPRVAAKFADDEAFLVDQASRMSYKDFARMLAYWLQVADMLGESDKAKRQHEGRHFAAAETFEGCWDFVSGLDKIGGTQVNNEIVRLENILFTQDWNEAKAIHGDDTRLEHLKRTPTQRRADAFVLMAKRSHALPDDIPIPPPLITVLVGWETFKGRLCETEAGTVLDPSDLFRLLEEADIERVVFDTPSRVIEVGQRQRFFTGALRRAIEVRDRHCQHPGCDVPASQCEADHIVEYANGGPTVQSNGRMMCGTHNRTRNNRPPPPRRRP
jgi:hypothetical protein